MDQAMMLRRIEQLETLVRRLRLMATAITIAFGVLLVTAQAPSRTRTITADTVHARVFLLESRPAQVRGLLTLDSAGTAILALVGDDGRGGIGLAAYASGRTAMEFADSGGRLRSQLTLDNWGPSLRFYDDDGRRVLMELAGGSRRLIPGARINLYSTDSTAARIDLSHALHRGGQIGLAAAMDGSAYITLSRAPQTPTQLASDRIVLRLDSAALPSIALRYGQSEIVRPDSVTYPLDRLLLELSPGGLPALTLFDDSLRARAVLGHVPLHDVRTGVLETRPPGSLVIFNDRGGVLWKIP